MDQLDPEALLERLRAEHRVLRWAPLPPEEMRRPTERSQSRSRTSLEYLHGHWSLPDGIDPAITGSGLKGRIIALFGRLTFRVLGPYLREERELLSHLVRVSDSLEKRCDELTLRCEQLNQDLVDRQAAEAENLTELALWLHLETPDRPARSGVVGEARGPEDTAASG